MEESRVIVCNNVNTASNLRFEERVWNKVRKLTKLKLHRVIAARLLLCVSKTVMVMNYNKKTREENTGMRLLR